MKTFNDVLTELRNIANKNNYREVFINRCHKFYDNDLLIVSFKQIVTDTTISNDSFDKYLEPMLSHIKNTKRK